MCSDSVKPGKNSAQNPEREIITALLISYQKGELTAGQILKIMRREILEMNQTEYAILVGISRRTLCALEQDQGSPTLAVFNAAFRPFGLQAGLITAL
ncbi:helix-turn-helix domain-containing protein [Bowmanella dokdonensis]|uniref:Uncharacterized protein n=1 Tax=Bowmanella dokdonensis TaxID=751969 RepID=A0A939IMZ9_9ALTE|nr:helix-turn-helix transcriptional regulator [Bowmanella dokdonensis]MBN7825838.1 hypothetical protein [Bowmanella dokdonensis]